jgi:hypothetical protein
MLLGLSLLKTPSERSVCRSFSGRLPIDLGLPARLLSLLSWTSTNVGTPKACHQGGVRDDFSTGFWLGRASFVTMVQAADLRESNHFPHRCRLDGQESVHLSPAPNECVIARNNRNTAAESVVDRAR